jgi:endonuclease YncB( thermonuclease family)
MLRRLLIALSSLALLSLAPAASAADMVGQASIIDGHTIEIHGQRIGLFGIDAPEHNPSQWWAARSLARRSAPYLACCSASVLA